MFHVMSRHGFFPSSIFFLFVCLFVNCFVYAEVNPLPRGILEDSGHPGGVVSMLDSRNCTPVLFPGIGVLPGPAGAVLRIQSFLHAFRMIWALIGCPLSGGLQPAAVPPSLDAGKPHLIPPPPPLHSNRLSWIKCKLFPRICCG